MAALAGDCQQVFMEYHFKMIDYHTYRKIRTLWIDRHVSLRQIAFMLSMSRQTVRKWAKLDNYADSKKADKNEKCYIVPHKNDPISDLDVLRNSWMLKLLLGCITTANLADSLVKGISDEDAEALLKGISEGNHRERTSALSVVANFRGIPIRQIAQFLQLHRATISKHIRKYREKGLIGLFTFYKSQPHMHEQDKYKDALFSILHSPPSDYGINRTSWKMTDLQDVMRSQGVPTNKHTIQLIIRNAGYRFRKAKKVLTSTDPNYKTKLMAITSILSNLKASESFFSIDEFGPLSVRTRGGVSLTHPDEKKIVPQFQRSKGRLLLTGALELSTNQFTYFYSERKNTAEMIKLLHLLITEYKLKDRIYFSWDSASWHDSKEFNKEVRRINTAEYRSENATPEVRLAPLPSCAQFLNVIESIFSGMARAIIHNSNYESVEECKSSIDRYFTDRNQFFKDNPKRAGDKIWGKERVLPVFNSSNNCKDLLYR